MRLPPRVLNKCTLSHRALNNKILVCPLLRCLPLGQLLERNVPAGLDLTPEQHAAVAVLEQVALGPEPAQRLLQLVGEDKLEVVLGQLEFAKLLPAQLVVTELAVRV